MIYSEITISVIEVVGGWLVAYDSCRTIYNKLGKRELPRLMNELVDKDTPVERQRKILRRIQVFLFVSGTVISNKYINAFSSDGRDKISVFRDIYTRNNIKPTRELCVLMLGAEDAQQINPETNK